MCRGRGGQGSLLHRSADPVALAANVVLHLQDYVSREVDQTEMAVVTCAGTVSEERGCRSCHIESQHQDHFFTNEEQGAGCLATNSQGRVRGNQLTERTAH